MSRQLLLLTFSVIAIMSGCATTRSGSARVSPEDSVFAKQGHDAQVERALEDLLGDGVGVRVSGKNDLGFPLEEAYSTRSYADHVFLRRSVIEPVVRSPEGNQALQKARCAATHICEGRVSMRDLEVPAVKLELAKLLVEKHPRRQELLDSVHIRLADQVGGQRRSICYVAAGATEPALTLGSRGCSGTYPFSDASFYEAKPIAQRSLAELKETEGLLANVGAASAMDPAVAERLARVRDAERVALAHVARNATGRRQAASSAKARSRVSTPPPRG